MNKAIAKLNLAPQVIQKFKTKMDALRFRQVDVDYIDENYFATVFMDTEWPKNETYLPEAIRDEIRDELEPKHPIESNYVVYNFNDVRVRGRMMKLMDTELVRLMDREFMKKLKQRIIEEHESELQARLDERARVEILRESMLVLRGIMPKEKGPPEVSKLMSDLSDEKPTDKKKGKEKEQVIEEEEDEEEGGGEITSLLDEAFKPPSVDSDISPIHSELPDDELEQVRKTMTIEIEGELEKLYIKPTLYEKEIYETDNVKNLRKTKGVDNLYVAAEKIFHEI